MEAVTPSLWGCETRVSRLRCIFVIKRSFSGLQAWSSDKARNEQGLIKKAFGMVTNWRERETFCHLLLIEERERERGGREKVRERDSCRMNLERKVVEKSHGSKSARVTCQCLPSDPLEMALNTRSPLTTHTWSERKFWGKLLFFLLRLLRFFGEDKVQWLSRRPTFYILFLYSRTTRNYPRTAQKYVCASKHCVLGWVEEGVSFGMRLGEPGNSHLILQEM